MKDFQSKAQESCASILTPSVLVSTVFGDKDVTVFDSDEVITDERNATSKTIEDVASTFSDPRLDLCIDGEAFAFITDRLPLDRANIIVDNGDTHAGLFLIAPTDLEPLSGFLVTDVGLKGRTFTHQHDRTCALSDYVLNDSVILGDKDAQIGDFLDQPMVFMTGDLYPDDNRRSTRDGNWDRTELSLIQWINGDGKKWGLSVHPEGKTKEGSSIVPSDNIEGARKDSAIKSLYAILIDVDGGTPLQHVLNKLVENEIFATVYTSFNHRTTQLELKHDDVMRKLKLDASPDLSQVKEYLRLHHATRYDGAFIDAVEIAEARKQTKNGMRIVLKVPPIDKFRVVIPLAEPVELADLAPTMAGYKDIWADKVTGVCRNILDTEFDTASLDINRLSFCPRHKKDAEFYSAIIMGKPLHFGDIEPYSKDKYIRERKATGDPFLAGDGGNEREQFVTPSGASLNDWHRKAKGRFLITDAIETHAADKVRNVGGERDGTLHIECVFEHEHSSSGGTATMCMTPHANEHEVWTVFCHHDACKGRDKLEFLQQMLADEWFDESVLEDPEFGLMDDEESEPALADPFSIVDEVASFTDRTPSEDIKKVMKRQLRLGGDPQVTAAITSKLVEVTALGKRDVNALWKEVVQERQDQKQSTSDGYPVINVWDFKMMCDWAEQRSIAARQDDQPLIFQYEGDIALYRNGARVFPTKDQFAATLNDLTKWKHQKTVGDKVITRGVSAPDDVVKQSYHRQPKPYPELLGTKNTPYFASDGRLVMDEGYDAGTGLFLDLEGLEVPPVRAVPTDEDVAKANCLFAEDVFGDFPFDGVTNREERLRRIYDESNPLPSYPNAVAMTLERFARGLIDGRTPCYTVTKPDPGTGGGLLIEVASFIATGKEASTTAMPTNEEEMNKTVGSIANSDTEFLWFDNMNTETDSGVLALAITSPSFKFRLLGTSNLVDAEVTHTWVAVANNFKGSIEILRRLSGIELNARVTTPEDRTGFYHSDLKGWVRENRGELVWAALTLIQNWVAKGVKPWEGDLKGSFENWSRVMGGIMRDAGIQGFRLKDAEFKTLAASSGDDDVQLLIEHLVRKHDHDTAFRPGGTSKIRGREQLPVSLLDEMNRANDGDALTIDGWGYNREDNKYYHARKIKEQFRDVARSVFEVTLSEADGDTFKDVTYDVSFEEKPDPQAKKQYYWLMKKTARA